MAASSLKPKLTQQVSALPEETLHEGRAAQIAAVCSVESFSDRWGKQWIHFGDCQGLACSLTSRWYFFHFFSSFLYFAITPKIKAPSPDTPFPSDCFTQLSPPRALSQACKPILCFSLSRPWHLIPSQISRSEISKRKLMWTLSHFNICEDVASNLPLTHALRWARIDSQSLCVRVCVHVGVCVCCAYCMCCWACLRGVVFVAKLWRRATCGMWRLVKASRLICPYPTQEIWVEPPGRPDLD